VWEWCQDWYGAYRTDDVQNPTGPEIGSGHVIRGGNAQSDAKDCRVSVRGYFESECTNGGVGFRVVLIP
ncbi:MAG: SUMF1/EgtB/PvdO family nonheme iron enzyme, partial [Odoribacter sp.]|nr:SUMF1/EgtB/PvdO family nonheme iron enzyme [Odoribacter sp.]